MRKLALGLIISGFCSLVSNAQQDATTPEDIQLNSITSAVPFLQITPDSRSGALGDAGTALGPSSSSFFWNTSMLAHTEEEMELSISYTPWLASLANDIRLSHVSFYKRVNRRNVVGGSLRYFSLGEITFTDDQGGTTMVHVPNEFEILGGYSYMLNDYFSLGVNGKFIYSNLTAGIQVAGAQSQPGLAGAADLSFSYLNQEFNIAEGGGSLALGLTLNNIGNKISYTEMDNRDFLPTNLKVGSALTFDFDKYNKLTWVLDASKMLVPTPPRRTADGTIISGMDPDVGVVVGMLQSFYDAPGQLLRDSNGDIMYNPDGTAQVASGSVLREELREVMIGTGLEYWYNDLFAARGGYFYEHASKGARQHFTFGIGLKYQIFGLDISYLTSLQRQNPLQNTVRFTLRFYFGNKGLGEGDVRPD